MISLEMYCTITLAASINVSESDFQKAKEILETTLNHYSVKLDYLTLETEDKQLHNLDLHDIDIKWENGFDN